MELDVLAHQGYGDLFFRVLPGVDHGAPVRQIRIGAGQVQALADCLGQVLLLHHQGNLVENLHVGILQHVIGGHVAEEGDLFFNLPV